MLKQTESPSYRQIRSSFRGLFQNVVVPIVWIGLYATGGFAPQASGQTGGAPPVQAPIDVGQTVNGFQDDFTSTVRNPDWVAVPPEKDDYVPTNGVLKVTVVGDNPGLDTHLLYAAPGYSEEAQEVLARIRVIAFGQGDPHRCGVAVGVNPDSSQGIDLHFRDHTQNGIVGRQFKLLDDRRAWAPTGLKFDWQTNTWYWLRLRQTSSSSAEGTNIFAKAWLGDGSVAEPANWHLAWSRDGRSGLAGIVGSSIGGLSEYEVDYILIKAEGLPSIKVSPGAFAGAVVNITQQPADAVAGAGQTATFTVGAVGSSAPTYQWQKANPGTTNFAVIQGATGTNYTTAILTAADNGAKYRSVVSVPGKSVTSSEATLTVDVIQPTLVSARTLGSANKVSVVFSEPVNITGIASSNFTINNSITITGVAPGANPRTVELSTAAITLGRSYLLTVSGVRDQFGNSIVANSQIAIDLAVELPAEFGQTVKGFQDDFTSAVRDPNWVPVPPEKDAYVPVNGVLKVTVVGDTPGLDTHLLYEAPGYSDAAQEVLARIRITAFGQGDAPRGGISVGVDAGTSQGINLLFRDQTQDGVVGRQLKMLDDRRAWGPPGLKIEWQTNTWYWLRLRQTGSSSVDGTNLFAKAWLGDGSTPEPADWQLAWARDDRVGYAGIVGSSIGGLSEYEVDYILIKADGLPSVQVRPSAFSLVPTGGTATGPKLSTSRSGNDIVLTWTGAGTLESADKITGPWTAVTGAASPRTVAIAGSAKFFRIRQ
jgi:hypothetical protein